jgi:heterodisulfide reductase subunit A
MASLRSNPNVVLLSYSEVEEVTGYVGNFKARIRKKARYVDTTKCSGCGTCWNMCPASLVPANRIIKKGDQIVKVIGGTDRENAQ